MPRVRRQFEITFVVSDEWQRPSGASAPFAGGDMAEMVEKSPALARYAMQSLLHDPSGTFEVLEVRQFEAQPRQGDIQ